MLQIKNAFVVAFSFNYRETESGPFGHIIEYLFENAQDAEIAKRFVEEKFKAKYVSVYQRNILTSERFNRLRTVRFLEWFEAK